jgi:biopolymer transport protein TolR
MNLWNRAPRVHAEAELNLIPLIDVMSVLVAFLLIYTADVEIIQNNKDVEIPQSVAEVKPQQSVVVMLTKEHLFVQGELVASIAVVRAAQGSIVEPLRLVLDRPMLMDGVVATQAAMSEREITVIADKSLPFDVVRKVMATCTASAYGAISLAVLQKEQAIHAAS